jgi:uncharacterized OB-fold protein
MTFARPPLPGPDDAWFWSGVANGQLLLQQCADCATVRFPPRPMCAACHSVSWTTVPASGRGRIHSWVIPRDPLPPGLDQPLVIGLIELDEGFRLVSNLDIAPEGITNDAVVEVVFEPVDPDGPLMHRFRLVHT